MFSFVTRHFSTTVAENPETGVVSINNINTQALFRDLDKTWKTAAIANVMLDNPTKKSVQLHGFFVPDLYFSLSKILEYRYRNSSDKEIMAIMEGLATNTWYADYFSPHEHTIDFDKLKDITYTLLPKQMDALWEYDKKVIASHLKGYLLAADTGTGKSVMGVALAHCLDSDPAVVICPKYIIDSVWVDAVNVQFKNTKRIWRSNQKEPLTNDYDYYIVHYEALGSAVELFTKYKFNNPVILLDESHNLNDIKSLRTTQYLNMCKLSGSQNIIHMSGTAVKALGTETIPLFRAIDDKFTPIVEAKFKTIYKKSATRALEILGNRMGMVTHKISKDSVMGSAKPIRKTILVELPDAKKYTLDTIRNELQAFVLERTAFYKKEIDKHEDIYHRAVNIYAANPRTKEEDRAFKQYQDYIATIRTGWDNTWMGPLSEYCNKFEKVHIMPALDRDLKNEFKNSKSVYKYVELKIMGEFLGGVLGRKRIELHSALIEHSGIDKIVYDSQKKTICFTNYVDTALTAKKYFEKRGFEPLMVYSDTNSEVLNIINDFKTSDTANPLIATIQSLSTGVTLVCANTVIFLNQPFRQHEYEQASARVFRLGQDTQVYLFDLILDTKGEDNLSTRMQDIMTWSRNQSEMIMNGKSPELDIKNFGMEDIGSAPADKLGNLLDFIIGNEELLCEVNEQLPYPGLESNCDGVAFVRKELESAGTQPQRPSAFDW